MNKYIKAFFILIFGGTFFLIWPGGEGTGPYSLNYLKDWFGGYGRAFFLYFLAVITLGFGLFDMHKNR